MAGNCIRTGISRKLVVVHKEDLASDWGSGEEERACCATFRELILVNGVFRWAMVGISVILKRNKEQRTKNKESKHEIIKNFDWLNWETVG